MPDTKPKDSRYITRLWRCRAYVPFLILAASVLLLASLSIGSVLLSTDNSWTIALITVLSIVAIGSLISFYFLVQKNLMSPLSSLSDWANRLHEGDLSARIPTNGTHEFSTLATNINKLSDNLQLLTDDMHNQVAQQTQHIAADQCG